MSYDSGSNYRYPKQDKKTSKSTANEIAGLKSRIALLEKERIEGEFDYHDGGKINCHPQYIKGYNEGYKAALQNKSDEDDNVSLEKLISELPEYGIDTSKWEYEYGDCCDGGVVEFLSRCIKGYAELQHENKVSDMSAEEILHKHMKKFCEENKEYSDSYMTPEEIKKDRVFMPVISAMEEYAINNGRLKISDEKFFKLFKGELLVKYDRLLRDKGMSSYDTNECLSIAFDDVLAAIVNERKDAGSWVKANEYLKKSIEYAIAIHGKIIRESYYGGSTFIVFEDMVCYRLNFEAYNNEVTADESHPQDNIKDNDAVEFAEWLRTFDALEKKDGYWVVESQISSEELYKVFRFNN